jgi:hypothetical protein
MKVFYNFSINHILVLLVLLGSDGRYTRNLEEKKTMFGPLTIHMFIIVEI